MFGVGFGAAGGDGGLVPGRPLPGRQRARRRLSGTLSLPRHNGRRRSPRAAAICSNKLIHASPCRWSATLLLLQYDVFALATFPEAHTTVLDALMHAALPRRNTARRLAQRFVAVVHNADFLLRRRKPARWARFVAMQRVHRWARQGGVLVVPGVYVWCWCWGPGPNLLAWGSPMGHTAAPWSPRCACCMRCAAAAPPLPATSTLPGPAPRRRRRRHACRDVWQRRDRWPKPQLRRLQLLTLAPSTSTYLTALLEQWALSSRGPAGTVTVPWIAPLAPWLPSFAPGAGFGRAEGSTGAAPDVSTLSDRLFSGSHTHRHLCIQVSRGFLFFESERPGRAILEPLGFVEAAFTGPHPHLTIPAAFRPSPSLLLS